MQEGEYKFLTEYLFNKIHYRKSWREQPAYFPSGAERGRYKVLCSKCVMYNTRI